MDHLNPNCPNRYFEEIKNENEKDKFILQTTPGMCKPTFDNNFINNYMCKNSIPSTSPSCYALNHYESNKQRNYNYPTPYDAVYGPQFNYIDPQQYSRPELTYCDKVTINTGINYGEEILKRIAPSKITKNNPITLLCTADDILESKDKIRESLKQGTNLLVSSVITIGCTTFLYEFLGPYALPASILIGNAIGELASDVVGNIYDTCKYISITKTDKNGAGILPGVSPGGESNGNGPGGIEFHILKPIIGINSAEMILLNDFILFFKDDRISNLMEVFNSFCLPNFQNRSLQEYFETIVCEISDGLDVLEELPFISLHFNQNHYLYSVMNPYYKNTLTGNILAYLDYFLKGFVNGGYFNIGFIQNWAKSHKKMDLNDLQKLNEHIISIRKELKKVGEPFYFSMHELLDQEESTDDFSSAFRIIGCMRSIEKAKDILFPQEYFNVEYDINPTPKMQKSILTKDDHAKAFKSNIYFYELMKKCILFMMPKVPYFKGFFVALNMITSAIHIVSSLRSIGKQVSTSNSFQSTKQNVDYVNIIPEEFPPIPLCVREKIIINYTIGEIVNCCSGNNLNQEIKNIIINGKKDFTQHGKDELITQLKNFYRRKISLTINGNSNKYDDEEIFLNDFLKTNLTSLIDEIPKIIKERMYDLLMQFRKLYPNFIETKKVSYRTISFMNFVQLEKECNKYISEFPNQFNKKLVDTCSNASRYFSYYYKEIINENSKRNITFYLRKEYVANPVNGKSIIGGCSINVSNRPKLMNVIKSKKEINQIHSSNHNFVECSNGEKGIIMKLKLIPMNYDGIKLINSKLANFLRKNNTYINKFNSIHIDSLLGLSFNIEKSSTFQCDAKSSDNKTPAYIACCSGSFLSVKALAQKYVDFGQPLANGISPFLAAIMNGHHQIVLFLLSNSRINIKNINQATETGVTALHWAVYHNYPDIVELLLKKGASMENTIRKNGMTPIHLSCYHDRPECLSILSNFVGARYDKTEVGFSPLHFAIEHSPQCAIFLIMKNKCNLYEYDVDLYSPYDLAIINGEYEIANILPKFGKLKQLFNIHSNSRYNTKSVFNNLCLAFSLGDVQKVKKLLKQNLKFTKNEKLKLIECACQGRCKKFVELISKILSLKEFPIISLLMSKNGIIEWIPEIEKYGGELMAEIDNKTILDEAVENSDSKFLENAFNNISSLSDKIIKRIVQKAILINDDDVMTTISDALISNQKINHFLMPNDIIFQFTKSSGFSIFRKNLVSNTVIKLNEIIKIISCDLVSYLLQNINFDYDDLIHSMKWALRNKQLDKAFCLFEYKQSLKKDIYNGSHNYYSVNQLSLENRAKALHAYDKLIKIDFTVSESLKIKQFDVMFKDLLYFNDVNMKLIDYAGSSIHNLWILKKLPIHICDNFVLDYIFDNKGQIETLFNKTITILMDLYDPSKAIKQFLNSLKNIDFDREYSKEKVDEFISALLKVIKLQYIDLVDDNNQTIFHIASKLMYIDDSNIEKMINTIEKSGTKKKLLIRAKSKCGETILMNLASSGNLDAIEKFENIGFDLTTRNIFGDNIISKMFNAKNVTNKKIFIETARIINKYPELILQCNRSGENLFMIAAIKGFNGMLGLMSSHYPINILDSSVDKSAIHFAAMYNHPETISYLVHKLHVDVNIKSKNGYTPMHIAAINNSIHSFKKLLEIGGNPFIQSTYSKMAAIDFCFKYGSNEMIQFIDNTPSLSYSLNSPQILIYLSENLKGYSLFWKVAHLLNPNAIFICDSDGQNLISVACMKNNVKIVSDLLLLGCDPAKTSFTKQNSIHICAQYDSIGCLNLILRHLSNTKGINGAQNILNMRDSDGNIPIHIAAKNASSGFLVELLCSCKYQKIDSINNFGNTPLDEALISEKNENASILVRFWVKILNNTIHSLKKIVNSDLIPKLKLLIESKEYSSCKKYFANIENSFWVHSKVQENKACKPELTYSNVRKLNATLEKFGIVLPLNVIVENNTIFSNMFFQMKIVDLVKKEGRKVIDMIIDSLQKIKSMKIKNIAFIMLLPKLDNGNAIHKFLKLIIEVDGYNINEAHPLFSWIENGLISLSEASLDSSLISHYTDKIIDLIYYIINNRELMNVIDYPILPCPIYQFASWLMNFKQKQFIAIQIQFAFLTSISSIWNNKSELSIDFCNRYNNNSNKLLKYGMQKNYDANIIEGIIQCTLELYESDSISNETKELILSKCIKILNIDINKSSLKSNIISFVKNSLKIIENFDEEYLKMVLDNMSCNSLLNTNNMMEKILIIGSSNIATSYLIRRGFEKLKMEADKIENTKFVESRKLEEILDAFKLGIKEFIPYKFSFDGTPIYTLTHEELEQLQLFGEIVERGQIFRNINDQAQIIGKKFKNNPTIKNAAILVGFVRQILKETLGINPFIVQCLTVGALLLHRINKNKRSQLKGRIAQVATGEGKSIIVAMLVGCIALTGNCIDVISSSSYLAERDAEKFNKFYQKLGLSCGTVDENGNNNDFDFHILYSTNTGFEFAMLREGISGESKIETTLLYENKKKHRPRMTAIVDEADNLFIDTSTSSARIAQHGGNETRWIYKPIFDEVLNNNTDVKSIRNELNRYANEIQQKSLKVLNDDDLNKLIKSAQTALTLKKNIDYIIEKNDSTGKFEVLIVDADNTGRIMHGSRWTNGLHEFVEVKERINIKEQSNTAAAISHPFFFQQYQEIYGLTGTLGEEAEREEIKNLYHIDSFDVPPNKKCLRKREKTLIVSTEKEKEKLILSCVKEMISKGRPILVIVYSIAESLRISDILSNEKINHYVLNDQQKLDEDFIVDNAGKPGSVTIATNTAGRGTDIRINQTALQNGGLHTLITFYPANLRVECQALGRAGRQGQPGSCQLIFVSQKYGKDEIETTDDILKLVYQKRTEKITLQSKNRIARIQNEWKHYEIMSQYFLYLYELKHFLKTHESELILSYNYPYINHMTILNNLTQYWAIFFTKISSISDNKYYSLEKFLENWECKSNYSILFQSFDRISDIKNKLQKVKLSIGKNKIVFKTYDKTKNKIEHTKSTNEIRSSNYKTKKHKNKTQVININNDKHSIIDVSTKKKPKLESPENLIGFQRIATKFILAVVKKSNLKTFVNLTSTKTSIVFYDGIFKSEKQLKIDPSVHFGKIPCLHDICKKNNFFNFLNEMKSKYPFEYKDFIPITQLICKNNETISSEIQNLDLKNNKIILKSNNKIHFVQSIENVPNGNTIQQFIFPYLIDGHKFDLRIYFMITNLKPLTLYRYNEGIAYFCSDIFDCPTNPESCFLNKKTISNPKDTDFQRVRLASEIFKIISSDDRKMWKKIERIAALTIISLYNEIVESTQNYCKINDAKFADDSIIRLNPLNRFFNLIALDFIIDKNGNLFIFNICDNPGLNPLQNHIDIKFKYNLIKSEFELINTFSEKGKEISINKWKKIPNITFPTD